MGKPSPEPYLVYRGNKKGIDSFSPRKTAPRTMTSTTSAAVQRSRLDGVEHDSNIEWGEGDRVEKVSSADDERRRPPYAKTWIGTRKRTSKRKKKAGKSGRPSTSSRERFCGCERSESPLLMEKKEHGSRQGTGILGWKGQKSEGVG